MGKKTVVYLTVAYGWTWALWIAGALMSLKAGRPIDTGTTLFGLFGAYAGQPSFAAQLLFALAVYGPLIGCLLVRAKGISLFSAVSRDTVALAVLLPLAISLPGAATGFLSGMQPQAGQTVSSVALAIGAYFLSNLATSGTEEFGWRGFLYPVIRTGTRTFWGAAWRCGAFWAAWHLPLMVILYGAAGPAVLIFSTVGLAAGILPMTWISNLLYERSKSIAPCMVLHALNNTASFALGLLFPGSPFTFVPAVMSWVAVAVLEKRYRVDVSVAMAGKA